jgi:hypothetical protein
MRRESLLTIEPLARVETTAELYDIAYEQAETAARRYGALTAIATGDLQEPVRSVFRKLEQAALHRARKISVACVASLDKKPDGTHLKWPPTDLVPADELSEVANSSLTTPYLVWALAVRHLKRGFMFWTYVAALADDDGVRAAAENIARDALHDANELRRERRLAWRSERHLSANDKSPDGTSDIPLAALLESLLFKDILVWSEGLSADERRHLLALTGNDPTELHSNAVQMDPATITATADARRRAVRRAEQLSSIYLDEADHASDPEQLELAQKLAAQAITRFADLRTIAAASAE